MQQRTDEKIADVLTKPLSMTKYKYLWDMLGMANNTSFAERDF